MNYNKVHAYMQNVGRVGRKKNDTHRVEGAMMKRKRFWMQAAAAAAAAL